MRRKILLMRTRGLAGPRFGRYHGWSRLIKSTGNFWGNQSSQGVVPLLITGAWLTTENCDGSASGKLISITGAWLTTENCDGSASGKLISITGSWSTNENCT